MKKLNISTKPFLIKLSTPMILVVLLGFAMMLSTFTSNVSLRNSIVNMLIYVVIVVGLYIFTGNTGVMSFGHAAFMAIGAYTAALMTMNPTMIRKLNSLPGIVKDIEHNPLFALVVASSIAALVGLVVGSVLMRLNGLAAGIATLALLVIVYVVLGQWTAVTGGPGSLVGVPVHTSALFAWVVASLAVIVAFTFQQSTTGLKLMASREDLLASRASGVRIQRLRVIAFTLSGAVVGSGGALFAMRINVLSPNAIYIDVTFIMLAMLVVGGTRSLTGVVLGVLLVSAVGETVRQMEGGIQILGVSLPQLPGLSQVAVALLLLISLIFRPEGLIGRWEASDLFTRYGQSMMKKEVTA